MTPGQKYYKSVRFWMRDGAPTWEELPSWRQGAYETAAQISLEPWEAAARAVAGEKGSGE